MFVVQVSWASAAQTALRRCESESWVWSVYRLEWAGKVVAVSCPAWMREAEAPSPRTISQGRVRESKALALPLVQVQVC